MTENYFILGTYKETQGDGQTVNVYGFAIANVNEKLQIENIEVPDIIFFEVPNRLLLLNDNKIYPRRSILRSSRIYEDITSSGKLKFKLINK